MKKYKVIISISFETEVAAENATLAEEIAYSELEGNLYNVADFLVEEVVE